MAGSSGSRRSRRRQLRASHQKNWLIGRHAVLETLAAGRWPIDELFVATDLSNDIAPQAQQLALKASIPLQSVNADRLTELCHADHHQGIAARMGPYPYADMEALRAMCSAEMQSSALPTLVVICDRIQDTFNFGAILRCCDAMKVTAVVIGSTEQAGVTPQVARSSAGAVNHVPVAMAENLTEAVISLRQEGFTVAAASEKSEAASWDLDLKHPSALIVGSEATGVAAELLDLCDLRLRIPMLGQVESLNAAVAAGILLYEFRRQQLHPDDDRSQ